MEKKLSWKTFLIDIFICSIGAFGGPEAHYGIFTDQLVTKKKYVSEDEIIELIGLCSILPGPSSTQTIVAIGHKMGGPVLALLTMLVWSLPVIVIMTALSFLYWFLEKQHLSADALRFIGPMAVGFIILAAYRIGKKVITDRLTIGLFLLGLLATYFIRQVWVFPVVLLLGGAISILASKEKNLWNHVKLNPPWPYFLTFLTFALGSILLAQLTTHRLITLFDSFYRYGYLVFGGGQVVVPIMHSDLVEVHKYMSSQEFLTGYGLVQGMPGPMFAFSAYAGGMASRSLGPFLQVIGALLSGIGIFLPGVLLIFFVYPIWENMKLIRGIKVSLKGINAISGGLITTSAILLFQKTGIEPINIAVILASILLLSTKKIPAPLIVAGTILLGIIL